MAFYNKLILLCLILLMMISSEATSYTLDLIHRDSPFSPVYDPSRTNLQRRTSSFLRSIARSSSKSPSSPITPFSGDYVTRFRIGNPPVEVLALVDTHSDLTWTQCQPCKDNENGCYKQKTPLFDPKESKTYRNLSCASSECALMVDAAGGLYPACDQDQQPCTYHVFYLNHEVENNSKSVIPNSEGDIAVETLTFNDDVSVKVVFGCGHNNVGGFVEKAYASGVLGLGRGSISLVNQLGGGGGGGAKYFSYCLTRSESESSKIRFGSNAVVGRPGDKVGSTPLRNGLVVSVRNLYTVTLEGISVGNQRIEYSSYTHVLKRKGNIVIDSATSMTVLPSSFYDTLESALVNGTRAKRVPDPRKTNGLCFEQVATVNYPVITAHFQGADLVLSNENSFLEVGVGVVCSTFLRGEGDDPSVAIFGNMHQRNILIGFDLDNHKVDFLPTDCAKPQ
ncbi:hypothetical protein ABFS83_14G026100 [Erythranthe nasuta]